jgi:hypothetical protein
MSGNQQHPDMMCEVLILAPTDLVDEPELANRAASRLNRHPKRYAATQPTRPLLPEPSYLGTEPQLMVVGVDLVAADDTSAQNPPGLGYRSSLASSLRRFAPTPGKRDKATQPHAIRPRRRSVGRTAVRDSKLNHTAGR